MEICLMIEGQENVTWEQWEAIALACEEHGLHGLFRSDHYAPIVGPPEHGSLDAWATLAALATKTERIRLGTLVSPVTFRHPSVLAKMAVTVDHLSGGRLDFGIGAGWYEADHTRFGFEFPDARTRMRMLAEQLEIVHRQWKGETFSFRGQHYRLEDCRAEPVPVQEPHPPIVMGGSAGRISAALAAKWADEYNSHAVTAEEASRRKAVVAEAFEREGRDPSLLVYSVMTDCAVGSDRSEAQERTRRLMERTGRRGDPEEFVREASKTGFFGTVEEVTRQLHRYEEAGVGRVMLRGLVHQDLDMVALLGREVVPAVA